MAWFKVDDGFYTSHKVLRIPRDIRNEALGAWLIVAVWAADKMTDGEVPSYIVDDFNVSDVALEWLIEVGLWRRIDGGICFHDWCEYQPSRDQLLERREAVSAARSEAGKRSGQARRNKNEQNGNKNEQTGNPEPEPEPEPLTTPKGVVRATRLPNDFAVTSDMAQWAQAKHPNVDLVTQTEAFRDYWVGVAGTKAVKADWVATWRNWIRNSKPIGGQRSTAFDRNMETVRMFEQQLEVTA